VTAYILQNKGKKIRNFSYFWVAIIKKLFYGRQKAAMHLCKDGFLSCKFLTFFRRKGYEARPIRE
jgi:hypothetical protein